MTQVLSIRHQQTLDLSDTGALREGRDVEVALRYAALTGGWLARFSGSREGRTALPVLLALALHARPLVGADFEHLRTLGLVTDADAGRLYCRVTDVGLAEELGLHRTTIPKAMAWLAEADILHVVPLPPEFSDSRGPFNGVRAYLLRADGLVTSTYVPALEGAEDQSPQGAGASTPMSVQPAGLSVEAPPMAVDLTGVSVEPAPVSVQPTGVSGEPTPSVTSTVATVSGEPTGHVSSPDTKKNTSKEREREERAVGSAFFQPLVTDPEQRLAAAWLAATGAPWCPDDRARLLALVGPLEVGKVPPDALCALLPVLRASGAVTLDRVVAAATNPALACAIRLYTQEIAPMTALTVTELWTLAQAHPDPARWEDAFRKAIGIPEPFRRWRYARTVLENPDDRRTTTRPTTAAPARDRAAPVDRLPRRSSGGRRPQGVWTPEEIAQINADAAARLAAQGVSIYD